MNYPVEFVDKGISTEGYEEEEEEAEKQREYNTVEAMLAKLVENKVVSIRESEAKEKRKLLSKFRSKSSESREIKINSNNSTVSSSSKTSHQRKPHQHPHQMSFESCDSKSKQSDSCYCPEEVHIKPHPPLQRLPTKTDPPKPNWINTSLETATTSSGYITPSCKQVAEPAQPPSEECQIKCENEGCTTSLPVAPCSSYPSSCSYLVTEYRDTCGGSAYRHDHVTGGHYVSCCNSPTHSLNSKTHYDDNYVALAMNLEDLEFEAEEERRKKRKRKKKRRKERLRRSRGLMADELATKVPKVIDPEDLPKRARWTIVATACLLLLMSLMLVGVTLRMAPIIDEMVRKENEELLNSLTRQGADDHNNTKIVSSGKG